MTITVDITAGMMLKLAENYPAAATGPKLAKIVDYLYWFGSAYDNNVTDFVDWLINTQGVTVESEHHQLTFTMKFDSEKEATLFILRYS